MAGTHMQMVPGLKPWVVGCKSRFRPTVIVWLKTFLRHSHANGTGPPAADKADERDEDGDGGGHDGAQRDAVEEDRV